MTRAVVPTKIMMAPDWRRGNPYQSLLARAVEATGPQVSFGSLSRGRFALLRLWLANGRPPVLHLHWINALIEPILWSRGSLGRWLKLLLLRADLLLVRVLGARVVWTIHNRVSHESASPAEELQVRSVVAACVDHVIVHSESALALLRRDYGARSLKQDKVSVIRHGNYIGCYPPNATLAAKLRDEMSLPSEGITLLFFGGIRPYKGIEKLVGALQACPRSDLRLLIAGQPMTERMRADLQSAAQRDPRILLSLRFIPDAEVAAFFELCDVAVIPFERTLTSGSAVLAMTMGRAVILPAEARILDLGAGAIFYDGDADLARTISELERPRLDEMGQLNRRTSSEWDWSRVGAETALCYRPAPSEIKAD